MTPVQHKKKKKKMEIKERWDIQVFLIRYLYNSFYVPDDLHIYKNVTIWQIALQISLK